MVQLYMYQVRLGTEVRVYTDVRCVSVVAIAWGARDTARRRREVACSCFLRWAGGPSCAGAHCMRICMSLFPAGLSLAEQLERAVGSAKFSVSFTVFLFDGV